MRKKTSVSRGSGNRYSEIDVIRTATTTSRIWIVADRAKPKRGRFSSACRRKSLDRGSGLSPFSPIRRRKPTSLNWAKAMSTVASTESTMSRTSASPISSSIDGEIVWTGFAGFTRLTRYPAHLKNLVNQYSISFSTAVPTDSSRHCRFRDRNRRDAAGREVSTARLLHQASGHFLLPALRQCRPRRRYRRDPIHRGHLPETKVRRSLYQPRETACSTPVSSCRKRKRSWLLILCFRSLRVPSLRKWTTPECRSANVAGD